MLKSIVKKLFNFSTALDRKSLADNYITGTGIEIGALHAPLPVNKKKATVRYVDRMTEKELRQHYPELDKLPLVHVDYVADGELLDTIPDNTQDFVIANHFIEHCQDTVLTLKNMLRVLKPGGIIFLAVPDKRFTFDKPRSVTSLEHILTDHEKGAIVSRETHFKEWATTFYSNEKEELVNQQAQKLMEQNYSIHFHVWEKTGMDELLVHLSKTMQLGFEIELGLRKTGSVENIYILRKLGTS